MDAAGLGSGCLVDVEALTGGTQNLMAAFVRDGRRYVLRRGPSHLRAGSNAALGREMTLLDALGRTEVPHARLVASCEDETVLAGAAFYLMEPVDGYNPAVALPRGYAETPETRHRLGLGVVEALARLGEVDHEAVGLAGFGRPDGFLERQVPRWISELESYSELDAYPGPDIGDVARVARWLERHRPGRWDPGIMHGDFHVANVMARHDAPEVAAIVDWEMTTIGDPLLDLGWMLSLWAAPGDDADLAGSLYSQHPGRPTEQELVAHYAERSSRDVSAIDWYVVLACFKLGIVLEGTYARSLAGLAPVETGLRLHDVTRRLVERALMRMES
ncbi:phosphotransferase family protein [Nocardioides sp. CBS4Y-1]|uniref:Phosphotransferase family protein n=2 Tax=Nocardioides acrostichi TaxID=2784339 RepID=A0A930UXJ0_9ACTN|nr:phosphotransferase family protein [Nocardioides acrostichi]